MGLGTRALLHAAVGGGEGGVDAGVVPSPRQPSDAEGEVQTSLCGKGGKGERDRENGEVRGEILKWDKTG